MSRLKELQYLNLALNNVETVENLQGCEFLEKLDFTVNFIGDLLSVESLCHNLHLQELYLTGNPCTEYDGYREFVVATLPQLVRLDGKEITKSERITALQQLQEVRRLVAAQQKQHTLKREKEKEDFKEKHTNQRKPGFDGRWYTDPQAHVSTGNTAEGEVGGEMGEDEEAYTPEYRVKSHRDRERKEMERTKEPGNKLEMPKRVRALERDGKMLNVNEGKYDFHLKDEGTRFVLEVQCPRYMETSLIDCDVQPTYVRVIIKAKILQLVLDEEVSPDSCSAKRSQTTGHLLLLLPKAKSVLRAPNTALPGHNRIGAAATPERVTANRDTAQSTVGRAAKTRDSAQGQAKIAGGPHHWDTAQGNGTKKETCNLEHEKVPFEDDPDVPPLI